MCAKVVPATVREVHYFDSNLWRGPEWYLAQMPEVTDDQLVLEKTPGYLRNKDTPKRMLEVGESCS